MPRMTKQRALALRASWQERAESWREKIRISEIINRLQDFTTGKCEMSPAQVKAAQVLLDRVMPTLSASEVTKRTETVDPQELLAKLKDSIGEEAYARLAKDYQPEAVH